MWRGCWGRNSQPVFGRLAGWLHTAADGLKWWLYFFFRRAGTATTVALNALCVMKMNVWCFLSSRELISVLQADYWQTLRQEGGSTATFSQLLVWCFSPLSWTSDDEADGEPIRNVQTTEKDDVRAKQVQKKTMPTTNTIETQSRAFSLQIGQTSLKL